MTSARCSPELLDRVRDRLARGAVEPDAETIAAAIRAEAGGLLGDTDLLATLRYLQTEMVGAGPLEPLLADPNVTDVLVNGPDRVWVDRGRGLERAAIRFDDDASVRRLAARLALHAGRRLDDAQPWVDGRLTALGSRGVSVRLHAMIPPLSMGGTCISLRVLSPAGHDLASLIVDETVPAPIADAIERLVRARLSMLIVGGTGAGKTTLLSALLGRVDPGERILCVEDAPELAPVHPHVLHLVARVANVEGVGEVTVRDLVRQALRMRPDRIVVGEVRGSEVIDLLTALNTGHNGCAGTLHANSVREVPARMEALAALGGMSRTALHSQLAAALDVVIEVVRVGTGTRRVGALGVLRRTGNGLVEVVPVWTIDDGFTSAYAEFETTIARRLAACGR